MGDVKAKAGVWVENAVTMVAHPAKEDSTHLSRVEHSHSPSQNLTSPAKIAQLMTRQPQKELL